MRGPPAVAACLPGASQEERGALLPRLPAGGCCGTGLLGIPPGSAGEVSLPGTTSSANPPSLPMYWVGPALPKLSPSLVPAWGEEMGSAPASQLLRLVPSAKPSLLPLPASQTTAAPVLANWRISENSSVEGTSGVCLIPPLSDQTDLSAAPDRTSVREAAPLPSLGQGDPLVGDTMLQWRRKEAGELSMEYFYVFLPFTNTITSVLLGADGVQREVFPCHRQLCQHPCL